MTYKKEMDCELSATVQKDCSQRYHLISIRLSELSLETFFSQSFISLNIINKIYFQNTLSYDGLKNQTRIIFCNSIEF
jgi:hypothetical protein